MALLKSALVYFNQAVRDGSIRKAADNLHIASSAINRQLLQLEDELGIELFVRLPRGIRPTAAGEALLACIRRWDRESGQLAQEIARLKGGVRGTIRIAAAESLTDTALPRAMAQLQERFPLVDYTLISGDNYRIRSELLAQDADMVCAFDIADTGPTRTIFSMKAPIGILMAPDHPLAEQDKVTLDQCIPYPVISPDSDWLAHSVLRDLLHDRGPVPLRIFARVERIGMLRNMVESGLGIAFLSRVGLDRHIEAGRLAWRPLEGAVRPAVVSVLVPRGRVLPTYLTLFAEMVGEQLQEMAL